MRSNDLKSTSSLWVDPAAWPEQLRAPPGLRASQLRGLETDVVIVGAGVAGLTAALELKRASKRVLVLDAGDPGGGESSRTTAHLTEVLDLRFAELINRFGTRGARLAVEGQRFAIDRIDTYARELGANCAFERLPGFLYAEPGDDVQTRQLEEELQAATQVGYEGLAISEAPAPFAPARSLRFENQAQFTPGPYLAALASAVEGDGCLVVNRVRVLSVEEVDASRCKITTDCGVIFGGQVIVAAHVPSNNRLFIHTKLACHRSYVVAAPVERPLPGLFWDLASPYHYSRTTVVGGRTFLVVGGEDHRVGEEEDTERRLERLTAFVVAKFGPVQPTHRWSGQIVETVDGLPYVGRNSRENNVFVATGFSGNGFSSGTLAGLILADAIQGRENRWAKLLSATRSPPLGSLGGYVGGNLIAAKHLVADRFKSTPQTLDDLPCDEGAIMERAGERLAIYRDADGTLHAMSAVCTHLGCHVSWNRAERSWDCPCHGSRFDRRGRVVNGPALTHLEPRPVGDDESAALEAAIAPPAFTT